MKKALVNLIKRLIQSFDGYRQDLIEDLSSYFNLKVKDVRDYRVTDEGVETGILTTKDDTDYIYEISDETKKLIPYG